MLTRVVGSAPLARQVGALAPELHLFGHSHIPIDLTLDDGASGKRRARRGGAAAVAVAVAARGWRLAAVQGGG
jgi:hypothetical protein